MGVGLDTMPGIVSGGRARATIALICPYECAHPVAAHARTLHQPAADAKLNRRPRGNNVRVRRNGLACIALALVVAGCGTPAATLPTSADELLTRLIETGDSGGFTKTRDFAENCPDYLAGTERHQLVVGYAMFEALRDIELTIRGLPFAVQGQEPTGSPIAEAFRAAVVARCTERPNLLVRGAAALEYLANHDAYVPD